MKFFKSNKSKSAQNIQVENPEDGFDLEVNQRRAMSNTSGRASSNAATDALDPTTQVALLRTFENFYEQESEAMITVLEESREEIKNSMLDLFYEQEHYKEELFKASEGKYNFKRKKENLIPLAEYLRRKRGTSRSSDSSTPNDAAISQSEKEAVEKYIRKKERLKQAEQNRLNREMNDDFIEVETQKILTKLNDMDLNKEKERQRQMDKLQAKLKGKPQQKDEQEIVGEIMDTFQDSKYAFERDKKLQQSRFQARLSARRGDSRNVENSKFLSKSSNVPMVDI